MTGCNKSIGQKNICLDTSDTNMEIRIGMVFDYKKYSNTISCAPFIFETLSSGDIILKSYSILNKNNTGSFLIAVDINEIIRYIQIIPANIFKKNDSFKTAEGYDFYTNFTDLKLEDFEIKQETSDRKVLKLKSGWFIDFDDNFKMNPDIEVKCSFFKIDEKYFEYIRYGFEKGILDKTYSDECRKKIREFIIKEGIPYG